MPPRLQFAAAHLRRPPPPSELTARTGAGDAASHAVSNVIIATVTDGPVSTTSLTLAAVVPSRPRRLK